VEEVLTTEGSRFLPPEGSDPLELTGAHRLIVRFRGPVGVILRGTSCRIIILCTKIARKTAKIGMSLAIG
jgi:hypothetical protein